MTHEEAVKKLNEAFRELFESIKRAWDTIKERIQSIEETIHCMNDRYYPPIVIKKLTSQIPRRQPLRYARSTC